jgi:hypothetical protein
MRQDNPAVRAIVFDINPSPPVGGSDAFMPAAGHLGNLQRKKHLEDAAAHPVPGGFIPPERKVGG